MGKPCIDHHHPHISAGNATLCTAHLTRGLKKPAPSKRSVYYPMLQAQASTAPLHRSQPTKAVVIGVASSDLVSKAFPTSSVHSGVTTTVKTCASFLSGLGDQITGGSENLLNNITSTNFLQSTLSRSVDKAFLEAVSTFTDLLHLASLSSPALPAATGLITLTGLAIALRSSVNLKDLPSPSSCTKALNRLSNILTAWNGNPSKHSWNEEDLPLQYDPQAISDYYEKRPHLVFSRVSFILLECSMLLANVVMDSALGKAKQNERLRASQVVNLITRLGPAAIKVGQALSIRPDLLPPTYLEELQKLQDRVPPFCNAEAKNTILQELGLAIEDVFSEFPEEPIAAASLGQVYKAKLRDSGETVAVKVQRPQVLETVCLDLYILRALAKEFDRLPNQESSDYVTFVDHWAGHFFQELDYRQEARNAEKFSKNMKALPNVVVPRALAKYTSQKVLTTSWIEGGKLSESTEEDVSQLVSVALNCYLVQLLESGFLHADPHPGNLLRTPDGRLCVLDFGLMIQVTEDQRYALIDYISHLVNTDYEKVADDLIRLGFLPPHLVNHELATEILPQLSRVVSQLVRGGGLKQMDVEQIIADLTQMAKDYAIVIPPYFAMILRAFSILEGIGLKTNPNYAIVDECYPYLCKRLLTDDSPRIRMALKYFLYGKKTQLDARRVEAILVGFQSFRKTMSTSTEAGKIQKALPSIDTTSQDVLNSLFAPEGSFLQELLLAELVRVVDALSREAIFELWNTFIGAALPLSHFVLPPFSLPLTGFLRASPLYTLSEEDQEALTLVRRLGNLLSSEMNKQTVAEMTAMVHGVTSFFPGFAAGAATASTRFWLMLLHRKALRFADDLDGRNTLMYWNMDPAASARHVRPFGFFSPPKDADHY